MSNQPYRSIAPAGERRGLTLIELLVVIVILSTLVAAVIPAMTPSTSERRIREAARGLNTFIATQQARALTGNRPMGIGLARLSFQTGRPEDRGVCLEVYAVEQPAPFAGFDSGSAARVAVADLTLGVIQIQLVTRGNSFDQIQDKLPPGWDADILPAGVIRPGDVVEVAGNRYVIIGSMSNTPPIDPNTGYFGVYNPSNGVPATFLCRPQNATGQSVIPYTDGQGNQLGLQSLASGNGPYWSQPGRYKIHRQPAVTGAAPYQLPEGVAIDLQASGMMDDAPFYVENIGSAGAGSLAKIGVRNNNDMIFIMFAPDGSIGSINYNRGGTAPSGENAVEFVTVFPTSSVALLVGRRELIPVDVTLSFSGNPTASELEQRKAQVNWLNLESAWVNIGYQSGSVITTSLANVDPVNVAAMASENKIPDYVGDGIDPLDIRREQIVRAREFARDSSRLGGK